VFWQADLLFLPADHPAFQSDSYPDRMPPTISLVTPNLNYGRHLRRTITSVVDQNYPALDYVVIDGGSTDESVDILQTCTSPQLRWEYMPGVGQFASINHGFAKTDGEIMGWINSDDILLPWTLQTVGDIFTAFPEIDWIMGAPSVIQGDAIHEVAAARPFAQSALGLGLYGGGRWGIVQQESCFWRRRLWEKAGPLREDLRFAADFELWIRFARNVELATCTAVLGGFTIHGSNRSRVNGQRYTDEIAGVVASLPAEERNERERLDHWHARYERNRWLPGLKRLVRHVGRLASLDGPVIRRDVVGNCYVLAREAVCP
jgi:glycosyltransferase involved in cell wall biosynthesis